MDTRFSTTHLHMHPEPLNHIPFSVVVERIDIIEDMEELLLQYLESSAGCLSRSHLVLHGDALLFETLPELHELVEFAHQHLHRSGPLRSGNRIGNPHFLESEITKFPVD